MLTTLLIGDVERAEFRDARDSLVALTRTVAVPTIEAALTHVSSSHIEPDLIVIAQARPGEFSSDQIDRLRALAPLARVVALVGSWCGGEPRTGKVWPGVNRVYWHEWLPRLAQTLDDVVAGHCPAWGLPVTASGEERLLARAGRAMPPRQGLIAIWARWAETADALSDGCTARGYSTVWLRPDESISVKGALAAIWDGGHTSPAETAGLRRLARDLRGVPIVALLDFPRTDSRDRALAAGASSVVAKPLLLDDLFWQLERALGATLLLRPVGTQAVA